MIDHTHSGWRCHTRYFLRTVKGDLPRGCPGTIAYETENLGRQLILVNWDQGFTVPAFADEIDIEGPATAPVLQ